MKYPYQFVDQKVQDARSGQVAVQLYCYSGKINRDNLMEFCMNKNEEFPDATQYTLMIIDTREYAAFVGSPPSEYLDDENAKHIRAVYTYNPAEQSSNLDVLTGAC